MFRTTHTLGCVLILSAVALLVTPGLSYAQRGGGRGGGGHYGGIGGYRGGVGGYRGGVYCGSAYYGGNRYPYARFGYGYGPYFGGYSIPYYGSYAPDFYDVPTYDSAYAPIYYGSATYGTAPSNTYQSFYPPPAITTPADTSAHIRVTVPAGAEIWFDGTPTTSTGTVRQFNSPPLTPGNHSYEIRARWSENGREVTQTQRVEVTPGAHVNVGFPVPATVLGQAVKSD
jgi:uncharacterized protein (TIGR03000 family)